MPKCSVCGSEIEKMPAWLNDVNVTFRCSKCPTVEPTESLLTGSAEQDDEELETIHLSDEESDEEIEVDEETED